MIEFVFSIVNFIAGVFTAGFGFAVALAGLKILYTGLGWLF